MSTKSNWVYSVLGVDRKVGGNNNNVAQNNTDENFFTKKAHSIGNTVGTTISAPISLVRDIGENIATYKFQGDSKSRMNDVAKKYGYNTYHDIWDARDKAEAEGDTATLDFIDNTINPELQAQANANAKEATDRAKGYEDYRKNNLISKNINQDNAKYLGSAINTLSTGFDVMSMAAGIPNGPVSNAVQGAVEGFADELERNGGNVDIFAGKAKNWDNFDIGRAGQNAAIGAAAGLATGALNKGINNSLAKNGGNLFKGGNKITAGINKWNSTNPVGKVLSTVGTGAARGAQSGLVGGAVGSGLSSAMNGVELGQGIANTVQGAVEGAKSGAITGGVMAGANLAANAALNRVAPKTMEKVRANQARNAEYGDTIREQWDNAWKDRNGADTEVNMANNSVSGMPTNIANEATGDGSWRDLDNMVDRSIAEAMPSADIAQVKDTVLENVANKLQSSGVFDSYEAGEISDADYRNYAMAAINDSVNELANQPSTRPVAQTQIETASNTQLSPWDRVAQESGYASYDDAIRSFQLANPDVKLGANDAGRILTWMDNNPGEWNPNMGTLNSLNPTGTVNTEYDPTFRATAPLGEDLTTYAQTAGISPDQEITIYRGVPKNVKGGINAGDYVTTNRQLAQDYAGDGRVIEQRVPASSLLDSVSEPLGEEYIYRPQTAETEIYRTLATENNQPQIKTGKQIKGDRKIVEEITSQFNAPNQPTVRATKPQETFKNLYNEWGLSDGDDIRQAVSYAEQGALIPQMVREAAGEVGVIDLSDAQALIMELKLSKQASNRVFNALEQVMDSTDTTIFGGKQGIDALELQRDLQQIASDARGTNGTYRIGNDYVDETMARNFDRIADHIGQKLDEAAVQKGVVPNVLNRHTQDIQNMKNAFPDNTKWQNAIDTKILSAKNIGDLRHSMKDLVRANIFIKNGDENFSTVGGRWAAKNSNVPTSKAGIINRVTNWAVDKLAETPMARNLRLSSYAKAAKGDTPTPTTPTPTTTGTAASTPATTTYNPSTQIYNMIGRDTGERQGEEQRVAQYLTEAQKDQTIAGNTLEGLVAPLGASTSSTGGASTSVYNSVYGAPATAMSYEEERAKYFYPPTGDYWTDMISQAMRNAKNAEDYDALGSLYEMYMDAVKQTSSEKDYSDPKNWSSADRKQLLQAENGLSQIDALEQSYINAVGDGGNAVQGTLRQWANNISAGNLDPAADNYVKQANSIGAGLIKNLVNLGSTEHDAQRYIEYLPKITDTKEQAAQKLQDLRNAYYSVIENLKAVYNA